MYTVSDLIGVSKNNGRGLVIYLTTSQRRQTTSGQTFERMLGTLGRDLQKTGAVVIAFPGDEDVVSSRILSKDWIPKEKEKISKRPGLLIIDENFDEFDPQVSNWFHINLAEIYNSSGTLNEKAAEDLVIALHGIFLNDEDMFYHLNDRKIVQRRRAAGGAFSVNPRWFGVGIDVKQFLAAMRD